MGIGSGSITVTTVCLPHCQMGFAVWYCYRAIWSVIPLFPYMDLWLARALNIRKDFTCYALSVVDTILSSTVLL